MKVRYKERPTEVRDTNRFNIHSLSEIDMYDDSAPIRDLEVLIGSEWYDMNEAFTLRLIVPNNHNTHFAPPLNEDCRDRGYNP